MRGAANSMLGNFSKAVDDLNNAINIDSTNYKPYFYFGRVYLIQGFYLSAIKYFNKSISLKNNDPDLYDDRALAKAKNGDCKGAIEDENIAIKLNANNPNYFKCRGWAYQQCEQYHKAIEDYNKSISIKSDFQTFYDRGATYEALGENENALKDFNYVITNVKNCGGEVYYHRSKVKTLLGNNNEACDDMKKSLELGFVLAKKEIDAICR